MPRSRHLAVAVVLLALACSDDGDALLTSGKKLYSQFDEELVIRHFFADRRGGFFVDVGAYHWKKHSTTYYLEEHLGWSGIAVDAQAAFAPGYARNRPRTRFFSYIVTDHSGATEVLHLAGPLSSTNREHVADVAARYTGEAASPDEIPELRKVEVETITLDDLLDREGVEQVDFLSMDIEQGEPAALAGFDIERFRPELVCIEAFPAVAARIEAYFAEHGYERIEAYRAHDEVNWYYTPSGGSQLH